MGAGIGKWGYIIMKYRDVSWNLMINDEQASFDDNDLDFIASEIERGNTSGLFTSDCTDYNLIEKLTDELEQELGRNVDFSVEENDKGELLELLDIAEQNNDNYVADLVKQILFAGFDN